MLRKVLSGDNGIATRHLAVTNLEEAFVLTPDVLHARYTEHTASRWMPISQCTFCRRLTENCAGGWRGEIHGQEVQPAGNPR